MELGQFSVSLTVRDLAASKAFYTKLGFEEIAGDEGFAILGSGGAVIGLFQGMFERNILTFNPTDVRAIRAELAERGIETPLLHEMPDAGDSDAGDPAAAQPTGEGSGPAHIMLEDPDGNPILIDQH